jgi:hypothetical protein
MVRVYKNQYDTGKFELIGNTIWAGIITQI